MRTPCSIFLLITGVVLLIGGLFTSAPQLLEPSPRLMHMPPEAAPWLLIAGALSAVLGLCGLLGVFQPRHAH